SREARGPRPEAPNAVITELRGAVLRCACAPDQDRALDPVCRLRPACRGGRRNRDGGLCSRRRDGRPFRAEPDDRAGRARSGAAGTEGVRCATRLPLDVHLMIEDAERWVASYANAGADLISVHIEACPHLHRTIGQIKELGKRPCVVMNPHTPIEAIEWVLG